MASGAAVGGVRGMGAQVWRAVVAAATELGWFSGRLLVRSYNRGMSAYRHIAIDPAIRFGRPCLKGTRISVGDVLGFLAAGMSVKEVAAEYPQISEEAVRECLAFAADRENRMLADLGIPPAA